MVHIIDLNFLGLANTIAAFLIKTREGAILIETGPYSTFDTLKKGIEKTGSAIEEVKHVFLTHIHLDHAGSAWAFARLGAKIHVHPFGYKHLSDPSKLMKSATRIYKDQMDTLWGRMEAIPDDLLQKTDSESVINIGNLQIKAWHTPGHAVHHIAWQVGEDLFTGDVAGVKIHDGMPVPPCPPPDINVEDWQKSLALIRHIDPQNLYLTHFGKVEKSDIEQHLNTVERTLISWADWIKPHWEAGTDRNILTPDFQAFVKQQLTDYGVAHQDLALYEAANPSWMSVAGLLRYWRKKAEKET